MLYIDSKSRDTLEVFEKSLEHYVKKKGMRRSRQRKQLLTLLHHQSYPVGMERIMTLFDENRYAYSYPTLARHVNFFTEIGWLKVVGQTHRTFLLVRSLKKPIID